MRWTITGFQNAYDHTRSHGQEHRHRRLVGKERESANVWTKPKTRKTKKVPGNVQRAGGEQSKIDRIKQKEEMRL
ncbi:hypothetical protein BDR06DRAFT_958910 [Suillus hirtellus]|nr:hypothetical protein BDR06DRAFT_958910 [Suillus hirtellus]